MKTMGICMEGLEDRFENEIRKIAAKSERVCYVEIGIAYGNTLKSVVEILNECKRPFEAFGIDPKPLCGTVPDAVILADYSYNVLPNWKGIIDVCFVDGCHCKECVTKDFQMVSGLVRPGGLIMFHDFSESAQGVDQGIHGRIDVRNALKDLGFPDSQPFGCRFDEEWHGSTNMGGMAIVRKN